MFGFSNIVNKEFYKSIFYWKPLIFWKYINALFDSWSVFFHFFFLFGFFYIFGNLWHPVLMQTPSKVLAFGPLDFYIELTQHWVWVWTIIFYLVVLYAFTWAHLWIPDPSSGWIKPLVLYWRWWNKTFVWFVSANFRRADEQIKGKLYIPLFFILAYFTYRDWLLLQNPAVYVIFVEDLKNYFDFPWYSGYTLRFRELLTAIFIPKSITNICINIFLALNILVVSIAEPVLYYLHWLLPFINQVYQFPLFFTFLICLNFIVRKVSPFNLLLWLILLMINTILILFSVKIEFFSILILIVYIGAIAILFLFVIMLLDLREENELLDKNKFFKLLFVAVFFAYFDSFVRGNYLTIKIFDIDILPSNESVNLPDIFTVVFNLYTYELIPLLIISIILLVTMIGAIAFLIAIE